MCYDQVLHILVSLHVDKSRLHNDIDARNILVLKTGEVRLGGFGYSLKQVGKRSKFAGPYLHMSPERLLGLECSFPSDIWSLGMLALELALGKCWYDMNKFHGIHALFEFKQIVVAEPPPSLKGATGCSNELKSFVDKCLHKNIRARDSPLQLLEHPFILRYEAFMLPAGTWLVKKVKPEVQHGMFQNHSAQTHTGDVVQSHRKMSSVSAMNEILIKSSPRLRTPGDLMSQSVSSGGQNR